MAKKGFSQVINTIQMENAAQAEEATNTTTAQEPVQEPVQESIEEVAEAVTTKKSKAPKTAKSSTTAKNEENEVDNKPKKRKTSFGTKKKNDEKETEVLSVKLSEDVAVAFENEKSVTKKTASSVATELLSNIYDAETNTFLIDIPANRKMQTKDTSLNLPKELKSALIDNAKAKNMKTYEYFNKLMEAMLEE